jgi:predicted ATPase
MRIALTGAHATGKSTLAAELARALPGYRVVEEPYYQLESEGYAFVASPTLEDFEVQLERSIRNVQELQGGLIFDRSPADYIAYLLSHGDGGPAAAAPWFAKAAAAIATLDLLVFAPVERPDRIVTLEAARLRRRVDAALRAGLLADDWGFGAPIMEVNGSPDERVAQVLARIEGVAR